MTCPWQAAKAGGANPMMGIDGIKGVLADMSELGVWDTYAVKIQTLKTAIEVTDCSHPVVYFSPTALRVYIFLSISVHRECNRCVLQWH